MHSTTAPGPLPTTPLATRTSLSVPTGGIRKPNVTRSRKGERVRRICFTLNNYTEEEENSLKEFARTTDWMIFGHETGENGTPHLQGIEPLPYLFTDPSYVDEWTTVYPICWRCGYRLDDCQCPLSSILCERCAFLKYSCNCLNK